jgi:hypothetical protein
MTETQIEGVSRGGGACTAMPAEEIGASSAAACLPVTPAMAMFDLRINCHFRSGQ